MSNQSQVLRVSLIGAGEAGTCHLKSLLQLPDKFRVVCVVDDHPSEESQTLIQGFDHIEHVAQAEIDRGIEMCDAVAIAIPTSMHEELIVTSLLAGKHVFCEKPLVLTLDAVRRVYKLADEHNLKLLCAMTRRFDQPTQQIKKHIESGSVGQIYNISMTSRDNPYPKVEYLMNKPGIYSETGIHNVDMAIWLMKDTPTVVYAQGHCFNPVVAPYPRSDDNVTVVMKFPSGAITTIEISRYSTCGYEQRIKVYGDKNTVASDSVPKDQFHQFNSGQVVQNGPCEDFQSRYAEAFTEEWRHFFKCVREGDDILVTEDEVASVVLTLDAINYSRQIGLPVEVDYSKSTFAAKNPDS